MPYVSVKIHNVSIVDIFWAMSFVISSVAYSAHASAARAYSGRKGRHLTHKPKKRTDASK